MATDEAPFEPPPVRRDPVEANMLAACGGEITFHGRDTVTDSGGHSVAMYHVRAVDDLVLRAARLGGTLNEIVVLHSVNGESFIPFCRECSTPYPCHTIRRIEEVKGAYEQRRSQRPTA